MDESNRGLPAVVYLARDANGNLCVGETAAELDWTDGDGSAGKYVLNNTGTLQKGTTRFVKDE